MGDSLASHRVAFTRAQSLAAEPRPGQPRQPNLSFVRHATDRRQLQPPRGDMTAPYKAARERDACLDRTSSLVSRTHGPGSRPRIGSHSCTIATWKDLDLNGRHCVQAVHTTEPLPSVHHSIAFMTDTPTSRSTG